MTAADNLTALVANTTMSGLADVELSGSTNVTAMVVNTTVSVLANVTEALGNSSSGTATLTVYERYWLYYVLGPVICGLGLVCNVLNLCVLAQRELQEAPYTYLTALAIADLLFLLLAFTHLVCSRAPATVPKAVLDAFLFYGGSNICFNCGVWFTVVMTIERVLFVTNPLKFRPRKKQARIRVCIIFVICCIINVPRFFCYRIIEYRGFHYPYGTEFRESNLFFNMSWFHAVVITFIPLLILITGNTILIITLRRASRQRRSLRLNREEASRRDQLRLTRTLVAIVILFFICTTPSAFVDDPIAYALFGGDKTWSQYLKSPSNQAFIYVSNLLLFLNCSLNFVLYCAFNQKFRQAMHRFFARINPRKSGRRVDAAESYKISDTPTMETKLSSSTN